MTNFTRRLITWIACCTLLFGALAPSLAQAMSVARGEVWTEVCGASGVKLVKTGVDPLKQQTAHLEHCPFCVTHADTYALPPPGASLRIATLVLPQGQPTLFLQAPHPLAVWSTAQSRAPPSVLA
jgi:hypothetical protein